MSDVIHDARIERAPAIGQAGARATGLARAAAGVVLLARASQLVSSLHGRGRAVTLARALGLREIVQGVVLAVRPSSAVIRGGTVVDGLHLATMAVAVLVPVPGTRRLAAAAGAQAALELLADVTVVAHGVPERR